MKNAKKLLSLSLMLIIVPIAACGGGTTYGEEVKGEATTTIKESLVDGKAADGKDAIVEGKVTAVCPSGCWFDIADDNGNAMHILIGGDFAVPKSLNGKDVAVAGYLQYNKGKETVELVATGVTVR
jgi:hypothetical protein